jgi:hypothetical protein
MPKTDVTQTDEPNPAQLKPAGPLALTSQAASGGG